MISNETQLAATEISGRLWRFADCEFDELSLQLRVKGSWVGLELKPLEVLLQLLLRAGEVVSKEELLDAVWPGLTVVDGSLATAISKLRKALGDQNSSVVVTVPRVGYRLGVPVQHKAIQAQSSTETPQLAVGEAVPGREQWRLMVPLATSGRQDVWLAEHPKTHEHRVFKFAWDASRLRSLKREVTVARFLRETLGERKDFVRLLEWNFEQAPYFIESEYSGLDLNQCWGEGIAQVPIEKRLGVFVDIASAVASAHEAGVLHKDLKPGNILVTVIDGAAKVRVADFGSASLTDPAKLKALGITNLGLTQTLNPQSPSSLTGTLMYLAPEILAGKAPTARSDVYALGVILYQLAIGDFRKPLSPGWEADVADPLLREDIAQAACGDASRRTARARDLVEHISNLEKRRAERQATELALQKAEAAARRRATVRARVPWIAFAVLAVVVAVVATWAFRKKNVAAAAQHSVVAVLPFQNVSGDPSIDYLRFALPDEITTTLSHTRPLTIRPFSAASSYRESGFDLQKVGRELGANRIVTGRFLVLGGQLQITMEAVDTEANHLVWRDTVNVSARDSLALQAELAASARARLAPALGATAVARGEGNPPKSQAAYDLYLRTLPMTGDPEPNHQALGMLQRSVELDPTFAQAWGAISTRTYGAARYGGGEDTLLERSDAAAERALALDPDSDALEELAIHNTERGALVKAYQQAQMMVRRRPDNPEAHHALNYVLRYAGLLQEAAEHCETAHMLVPEVSWGSCSTTFMELHDYQRARDYLRKDLSSEWSKAHAVEILVRQGRGEEALKLGVPQIPNWASSYSLLMACVQHKPDNEIRSLAQKVKPSEDPEMDYLFAAHMAYCGQSDGSLALLKTAIQGKHCSYPAMDNDPMFASVRGTAEWNQLHATAVDCRNEFLAKRGQ